MDQIKYPNPEDIIRLNNRIPEWVISSEDFTGGNEDTILDVLFRPHEINAWVRMIGQRINDADYSLIMASFYYERGIPDEEWFRSESDGVKYFPNFNEEHNRNKFAFEYFSDVYFFKVFSALDTIAHLITHLFHLQWGKLDKVSFYKAVNKIERLHPELYKDLTAIMDQPEYKKINRLRNDSTHNFSDGLVDSGVIRDGNQIRLTVGNYMMVKEKYELMQWVCNKLIEIINLIT